MKPRSLREGGYGENAQVGGVHECGRDAPRDHVTVEQGVLKLAAGTRSRREMARGVAKRRSRTQRSIPAP